MAMVHLSIAVMTHPRRAERAQALADRLRADLVVDPAPDAAPHAWRTAREAWASTPDWATHRLVVQDDALPVAQARTRVFLAVTARPSSPIAFYAGAHPAQMAYEIAHAERCSKPFAVCPPGQWVPTVALCLPAGQARDLVAFAAAERVEYMADDEIVGQWARRRKACVLLAVPSLFDHDDEEPSLVNPRKRYVRRAFRLAS